MPNRAFHDFTSVGAGAVMACAMAGEQPNGRMVLEVAGGAFGGFVGGRLPDKIDPPTSPNHRHVGHGVLTVGGTGAILWNLMVDCQEALRAKADELATERENMEDGFWKLLNQLFEWLCRFLAGAMPGVVGGYGMHLLMDATTARGLPLAARGF